MDEIKQKIAELCDLMYHSHDIRMLEVGNIKGAVLPLTPSHTIEHTYSVKIEICTPSTSMMPIKKRKGPKGLAQ
jgi:hypothetical protein